MRVFLSLGMVLIAGCGCPKFKQQEPQSFTVSYVQCAASDAGDAGDASDDAAACEINCNLVCSQQPLRPGLGNATCTGTTPGDAGDTIAQCVAEPAPVDPPPCL
jgi:hypothetical protein